MSGKTSAHSPKPQRLWIRRHSLVVRITHWINVVCLTGLLMSGLQIFNATPALYWGQASDFDRPLLEMGVGRDASGKPIGVTAVFGRDFNTTGLFGLSAGEDGQLLTRGFPQWVTLPGPQWLAMGRRWHFFFAWILVINGLVYLVNGLVTRHFRRDLLPSRPEIAGIGTTIGHHLRLHFPKGDEARHYNVLQKLAYLAVIFILLPGIVLAGLTMSPRLDAAFPFLLDLFGGRQSARTVHFIIAALLLAFVIIHVLMVLLSGLWNNIRSMITGRFAIQLPKDRADDRQANP